MIKFDVLNRYSGEVQFTANIDCKKTEERSIKLGLAVKWAIKEDANLRYANLRYANLRSADLRSANLRSADLRSANLRYANLRYANLRSADLRSADLRSADLRSANLCYADLRYADLRYAKNGTLPVPIGMVGEEIRTGYAIWVAEKKKVFVRLGCFWGDEKEAIAAVTGKYGARSGYKMMVSAACKVAKERKILNPTEETA